MNTSRIGLVPLEADGGFLVQYLDNSCAHAGIHPFDATQMATQSHSFSVSYVTGFSRDSLMLTSSVRVHFIQFFLHLVGNGFK